MRALTIRPADEDIRPRTTGTVLGVCANASAAERSPGKSDPERETRSPAALHWGRREVLVRGGLAPRVEGSEGVSLPGGV
jgi:hypothetical protein